MNRFNRPLIPLLIAFAGLASHAQAQLLSTAFSYQGKLTDAGIAPTAAYDFQFKLFNALTGGVQVGATVASNDLPVATGLFTARIDFGDQFDGNARFLQVEVRPGASTGAYTVLGPRTELTAAPYASQARASFSLDAADGSPANALIVDNNGNIGIGTTTPGHSVTIANPAPTIALQDTDSTTQQVGYISYRDGGNIERAWVGYGTIGSPDFSIVNARPGGDIFLTPLNADNVILAANGGSVGVGTSTPAVPLHVRHEFPALVLQDLGSNTTQSGYLGFWNGSGTETGWMGYGTPGSPHMTILNARSGGNIVLNPLGGGVVQVPVLEITGADLAEKFPASEKMEPGTVVAIDREQAGKLCVSRGAYNRCVAGVVSGANNFSVGAVLGNLPGQEDAPAIALSGRVYVRCDTSAGSIEPGDLLTTSDTPGHAMKATDRDRSHGTIIGKAMERLESGRGLVLVIVNLQ